MPRPRLLHVLTTSCLLCHVLLAAGCRHTASPPADATTGAEPVVQTGLNAAFLDPNLEPGAWVERFERESREIFRERETIMRALELKPGMDVADVGAGTGLFVPYFSEGVGSRGLVYAVEIAPAFVAHIEDRCRKENRSNVIPVLCTETSVELPADSIDLAFLCDVYHHFEHPRDSLASIHRALRPGGGLMLVDFKRVPGESSEWVLGHVRAGQEVFTAEIEAAGFKKISEHPALKENYMLRFEKIAAPR